MGAAWLPFFVPFAPLATHLALLRHSALHRATMEHPQSAPPTSLLGRYFKFLHHPQLPAEQNPELSPERPPTGEIEAQDKNRRPQQSTPRELWRIYAFNLLLLFPAMLMILMVVGGVKQVEDQNAIAEILQTLSGFKIFLFAVVFAPLLEELIFRLPLQYSPRNLAIPLGIIGAYLFNPALAMGLQNFYLALIINGGFAIALSALLLQLFRNWANTQNLQQFYHQHLRAIFYSSAILFGLIHIFNYDSSLWAFAPILTLPQLILGFTLGFVRLTYGFRWAVAFHAAHNFLATAPSIVMMSLPSSVRLALMSGERPPDSLLAFGAAFGIFSLIYFVGGLFLVLRSVRYSLREWRRDKAR